MMVVADMVPLDIVGPYEVLARVPGWTVDLVGVDEAPVRTDKGLTLLPTVGRATAPPSDILVIPGGTGVDRILVDDDWLAWVRREYAAARTVIAICTGSLLLGAAGLLKGRRAGAHWQARDLLARFGAIVSDDRLTVDGKLYSSGGVTSGIDMALKAVGDLAGIEVAQSIQLAIEYDPAPPWPGGTPAKAPEAIVAGVLERSAKRRADRESWVDRAVARLS